MGDEELCGLLPPYEWDFGLGAKEERMDWNPPSRSMRFYRVMAAIERGDIPRPAPVEMTIGEAATAIRGGLAFVRRRDDGRLVALDFDAATTSLVETEVVDEWPE